MTSVATLRIYGIASRNFISISMDNIYDNINVLDFAVLRFFGEISSNGCRPPVTAGVSNLALWAEKILKLNVFLCNFKKNAYTVVN